MEPLLYLLFAILSSKVVCCKLDLGNHMPSANVSSGRRLSSSFLTSNIPQFSNVDSIYVFHLRSFPLLLIETAHGTYSTQTSGLALRSTQTNTIVIFEYKPLNYSTCFLPLIKTLPKSTSKTLEWDKRAEIVYSDGIDATYWQHSTYLATINGVVYKNYISWMKDYISANSRMFPHSICSTTNQTDCYVDALSSETFLSDSFAQLASLSVDMHAVIAPRASELRFIAETVPVKLFTTPTTDDSTTTKPKKSGGKRRRRQLRLRSSPLHAAHQAVSAGSTNKDSSNVDDWDDNEWHLYVPEKDVVKYYENVTTCMQSKLCNVQQLCHFLL